MQLALLNGSVALDFFCIVFLYFLHFISVKNYLLYFLNLGPQGEE